MQTLYYGQTQAVRRGAPCGKLPRGLQVQKVVIFLEQLMPGVSTFLLKGTFRIFGVFPSMHIGACFEPTFLFFSPNKAFKKTGFCDFDKKVGPGMFFSVEIMSQQNSKKPRLINCAKIGENAKKNAKKCSCP